MNNLIIKPEQIEIDGDTYNLLLTVKAAYVIQNKLGKQITELIKDLNVRGNNIAETTIVFLSAMSGEELTIDEILRSMTSEMLLKCNLKVLEVLNKCMVLNKIEEEDDEVDYVLEEVKEHGAFDFVERMFTLGHVLGYRDSEIWNMIPRTIMALHADYEKYRSGDKPKVQAADVL